MTSVAELREQVRSLQDELAQLKGKRGKQATREKITKMSSEVVDSNPYSRLMALQRMGIVKEYEQIRQKSVAVVGECCNSRIWADC